MTKNHGSSIKDDEKYEALRDDGMSKSKAAAIANSGRESSRKGGKSKSYDEWSKEELYERAKELDIEGRSEMSKDELIQALRKGQ